MDDLSDLISLSSTIEEEILPHFNAAIEELPKECRTMCNELFKQVKNAIHLVQQRCSTIENMRKAENILKSSNFTEDDRDIYSRISEFVNEDLKKQFDELCKLYGMQVRNRSLLQFFRSGNERNEMFRKLQAKLLQQIQEEKEKIANNLVASNCYINAGMVLIEGLAIASAWQKLTQAKNLTEHLSAHQLPLIQQQIEELQVIESSLRNLMEDYVQDRSVNQPAMTKLTSQMTEKLYRTRTLIVEARFEVNRNISSVTSERDDQLRRCTSNGIKAASYSIQSASLAALLTTKSKWIQGITTASFFVLATFNFYMYYTCSNILSNLEKVMVVIDKLMAIASDMNSTIDRAHQLLQQ